ncbi:uncharacterized protein ARMOST_08244 [Armillaria ostoyae]|uniref:Reverse transcriptase Ty1/copia-type domain-containing protein n=1 Tax=Armillaria ostoyae TaxID=47428 RepID=A0A284R853_ARMOS|nr:uncharacterized protein ARMOST_08244 [Armillaria ostoyae]
MGTYTKEDLPAGRDTIGCKWVFLKKYDEDGNISRYKARLVAQGYSQIPGVDYNETFAPVVRLESVHAALGIAAIKDLEISQMDVKGAYLNGELEEEIYMRQPEGYDDGSGRVCRLRKTLYGLKQSGCEWNWEFDRKLTSIGFSKLEADHCVYKRIREGRMTIITVWVDDLLIFSETIEDMMETKGELHNLFDVKDLGEPKKIIGIEIKRDRENGTISLSQKQYIEGVLTRFGMQNARPVSTLLDPNVILKKRTDDLIADPAMVGGYQSVIGSLLYAARGTRPDISHAVQELGQFASNPGPEHWTALKRVCRYLAGTRNLELVFRANEEGEIISTGYSDASFASNPDDRKSISGYTYLIGGASFAWSSKKQSTVALSSTEAEYTALTHATRQAIWNRNLLSELGCPQEDSTLIFEDNQSTIALARDPQYHARSKHFDIQNHFIREKVENETIELYYCLTEEMVADIFTKTLPRPQHEKFV